MTYCNSSVFRSSGWMQGIPSQRPGRQWLKWHELSLARSIATWSAVASASPHTPYTSTLLGSSAVYLCGVQRVELKPTKLPQAVKARGYLFYLFRSAVEDIQGPRDRVGSGGRPSVCRDSDVASWRGWFGGVDGGYLSYQRCREMCCSRRCAELSR